MAARRTLADAIMRDGDSLGYILKSIEKLSAELAPDIPAAFLREAPFVAIGPIVAMSNNYLVQADRGGTKQKFDFIAHDRAWFLGQPENDEDRKKSVSVGHVLADRAKDSVLAKAIADGTPMAIGAHAGVNVCVSLTELGKQYDTVQGRHTGDFERLADGEKQAVLMDAVVREVALAKDAGVLKTIAAGRAASGLAPEPVKPAGADAEAIAEYEADLAATFIANAKVKAERQAEKAKAVADGRKAMEALREAAVAAARASSPALHDSRSTPIAPEAMFTKVRESALVSEHRPLRGVVTDKIGALVLLTDATKKPYLINSSDTAYGEWGKPYTQQGKEYTVGCSRGSIVFLPGNWMQRGANDTERALSAQLAIDRSLDTQRQRIVDEPKVTFTRNTKDENEAFNPDVHKVVASAVDERNEYIKSKANTVRLTVASRLGIDVTKILVEGQARDPKFTEQEAYSAAGIYVKPATVAAENRKVKRSADGEMIVDFGKVEWMRARTELIDRDVVYISARDERDNITRIYALECLAQENLAIRDSGLVTGVPQERTLQLGDEVEFLRVGNDDYGRPEWKVEILDRELEAGLRIKAEAAKRVTASFGPDNAKERATLMEGLRDDGVKHIKSVELLETEHDGRHTGTIHLVETKTDRYVAIVENEDRYQRQGGVIRARIERDPDILSKAFSKDALGVYTAAGAKATLIYRDGKPMMDFTPKADLALERDNAQEVEEVRELARSAERERV